MRGRGVERANGEILQEWWGEGKRVLGVDCRRGEMMHG